ncbi:hypothetical protein CMO96_00300 [Candidatus Woesebacteria bacterium]|nr:hypothetical protein [Candidatus Woesebacteria bacterium]
MSVEIVEGDIFEPPVNVIIHSTDCFHGMRESKFSGEIASRFPETSEADGKTMDGDYSKLGTFSVAKIKDSENLKFIVNLYAQFEKEKKGTRQVNYEALYRGLESFRDMIIEAEEHVLVVAVPFGMCCGDGGGNWKIVKEVLDDVFMDSVLSMKVYKKE